MGNNILLYLCFRIKCICLDRTMLQAVSLERTPRESEVALLGGFLIFIYLLSYIKCGIVESDSDALQYPYRLPGFRPRDSGAAH